MAKEGDDQFTLYHYNGLTNANRSARMVRFKLTKRSAENMVGSAIPLSSDPSSGGPGGDPIEEVLRTRWPGSLLDWSGEKPPSID
jgi:hypothetical protein